MPRIICLAIMCILWVSGYAVGSYESKPKCLMPHKYEHVHNQETEIVAEDTPHFSEEAIYITLPVYISSLIGTAMAAWGAAKYDEKKLKKMGYLQSEILALEKQVIELQRDVHHHSNHNPKHNNE